MNLKVRYVFAIFTTIIALHYLLAFAHEGYGHATSLSNVSSKLKGLGRKPITEAAQPTITEVAHPAIVSPSSPIDNKEKQDKRANAAFVVLARNSDLPGIIQSITQMENRFNKKYRYPYVFLNEEHFSEVFKQDVQALTNSTIEFGLITHDHWFQPDWIDEEKAKANRDKLEADKVIYGESVPYRNMCRFNSGFFFKHKLLQKYRWYWRIEPSVHYHCNIDFDPFLYMEENKKTYGFTISLYEFESTIPTLWGHVKDFMKQHPELIAKDNALAFLSHDGGVNYNLCHFWSNFEIADMEFWRSPAYSEFFEYLDSKGGFYYERWGDAPVHSIAAAMFLNKDQIHFFDDIGYEHAPFTHCPGGTTWKESKCGCNMFKSFDYHGYSCLSQWKRTLSNL